MLNAFEIEGNAKKLIAEAFSQFSNSAYLETFFFVGLNLVFEIVFKKATCAPVYISCSEPIILNNTFVICKHFKRDSKMNSIKI